MNEFIQSLRRLYSDHKITTTTLDALLTSEKINQQEYDYIISAENAI